MATTANIPAAQRTAVALRATHNETPDGTHALAYDAADAAHAAIERAGRANRQAIRDAPRRTDMDSTRGRLSFDQTRGPTLTSVSMLIHNGREADARV